MFYLVNKHKWLTSFWVLHLLRKKFGIKKIWHTGTLDPLATGLLIAATWKSTKLIQFLEKKEKTYVFSFDLSWNSPTWDLEWEIEFLDEKIIADKKTRITKEIIENLLRTKYLWTIEQIPPKFSAIKIDWKKAYELARDWKEFEMKKRTINISDAKLIDYNFPIITLEMTVSAWTYVRSLAEDIWKDLWLWWYVTLLHRSKIWNMTLEGTKEVDSMEIDDYTSEEKLFPEYEIIQVNENEKKELMCWREINKEEIKEWKRYFLNHEDKIISLIEWISEWKYIYLANELN